MSSHLLTIFLLIGGAAFIPFIARRFRIPSAAVEIMYGILVFNFIINIKPEWFDLLKEMGLVYLMFIVGMELDLRRFIKEKNFKWYIAVPLLSLLITPFVMHQIGYPFFLGVAVSMISAGIIIPVLKESDIIDSPIGRDIIGIALTGELLSIIVLMGVDIHYHYGFTARAALEGGKFLLLTVIAAVFLRFIYVIAWWNPKKVESVMESEDPVEEGIRIVIFMAFTGALVAYSFGLEPILGSFLAGLVFSYVFKSKGRFEEKINAVGFGLFIPFFFIGVGADFNVNLMSSVENLYIALFLTAMVFLSNIFPLLFSHFMGIKKRDALGMSLIFSAPLSMMVVAGTLGLKMSLINDELRDSLVLTAIIASILFPSLFRPVAKVIHRELNPEKAKGK